MVPPPHPTHHQPKTNPVETGGRAGGFPPRVADIFPNFIRGRLSDVSPNTWLPKSFRRMQYFGGRLSGGATWRPTFYEAGIPPRTDEYRGIADNWGPPTPLPGLPHPRNWGRGGVKAAFCPFRIPEIPRTMQYSGWRLCGVATWCPIFYDSEIPIRADERRGISDVENLRFPTQPTTHTHHPPEIGGDRAAFLPRIRHFPNSIRGRLNRVFPE